jgi:hypothetical protein
MDLENIVADLKRERDRLVHAITLLSGDSAAAGKTGKRATKGKRRGGITPAGRRRLSLAMKKRWAERRKKGS